MTTESETRRPLPELEAEQEIDFRRYGRALAARWWLLAAGLLGGLIVGYLIALGSGKVYKSTALLYLGQPFIGGSSIQTLATNPTTVDQIVHSEQAVTTAAARAGLRPGQLRGNISVSTITGPKTAVKSGQVPLTSITVTVGARRKSELAARSLANQVVAKVSPYIDVKIQTFQTGIKILAEQLRSNQARIQHLEAGIRQSVGQPALERLVLTTQLDSAIQQRGTLLQQQTSTQQQLAQAQQVEHAQVIEQPVAVKTTARSTRTSMLVAGVIGLLLGILAALLYEPLAVRFGRNQAG